LVSFYVIHKGGKSANKFCKSPIPQICRLKEFVGFVDLPQMWHFANMRLGNPIFFFAEVLFVDLWFAVPSLFAGWNFPQVRRYILFFLLFSIYCSYSNLYKIKVLFGDRVVQCFVEICLFAICGLIMSKVDVVIEKIEFKPVLEF
jgi:hypothetical protein